MSNEKMAERATAYIAQQRAQFTDGLSAIHTAHLRLQAALDVAIKERAEARAEVENLYDQIHRLVDDRAKAQSQADRLREQNYELHLTRDEARAEIERMRGDAQAIAAIAHTGGTAGLSEHEALVEIRRRTLKAWDRKTSRAALEAKP